MTLVLIMKNPQNGHVYIEFKLSKGKSYDIGSYYFTDIQIPHYSIQKYHAVLHVSEGGNVTINTHNLGKMAKNGVEILNNEAINIVKVGDVMSFGTYKRVLQLEERFGKTNSK